MNIRYPIYEGVYRILTDQGRIPYIQLGGKILYRQSDIEKLLEENYHAALV